MSAWGVGRLWLLWHRVRYRSHRFRVVERTARGQVGRCSCGGGFLIRRADYVLDENENLEIAPPRIIWSTCQAATALAAKLGQTMEQPPSDVTFPGGAYR